VLLMLLTEKDLSTGSMRCLVGQVGVRESGWRLVVCSTGWIFFPDLLDDGDEAKSAQYL